MYELVAVVCDMIIDLRHCQSISRAHHLLDSHLLFPANLMSIHSSKT
jgi:hypothetical protein